MANRCNKTIKLKGGFQYSIRISRGDYVCHQCGKAIRKSSIYVEERSIGGVVLRYHLVCFNHRYPHLMSIEETPGGVRICLHKPELESGARDQRRVM